MRAIRTAPRILVLAVACTMGHQAFADANSDLLFNCRLGGQIRTMIFEAGRNILWDSGKPFQATITPDTIDAVYVHDWSAESRMRHRILIGRRDRSFKLEVDEIGTGGETRQAINRDAGTCSAEKNRSRLLKNPDPARAGD